MKLIKIIKRKLNLLENLSKVYELSWGKYVEKRQEKTKISLEKQESKDAPVFIIGAPRSGSTILYQLITNYFDISYISNFIHIFNSTLLYGFDLNEKYIGNQPHNYFKSKYGKTLQGGWRSPNESSSFWFRYLPKEQHYIGKNEITDQKILNYYRQSILSVINKYKKPFIFKNLSVGQRMKFIKKIIPNAKFIFIKRDTFFNAQSIIYGRRKYHIESHEWWSIKPKNYESLLLLEEEEMVVKQIYFIEKQIIEDKNTLLEEDFLTIDYDELLSQPKKTLEVIHGFLGKKVKIKKGAEMPILKPNRQIRVEAEIEQKINKVIEGLNWTTYEST